MDICEVRRLKKELVDAINAKLWTSIVQLHFAATFLDSSLKEFRFCDVKKDKVFFRQQALGCIDVFVQPTNQISVAKVNVDDKGPGSTVVSQNETVHSELAINKIALTIANDTGYNEPYQKIRKKR